MTNNNIHVHFMGIGGSGTAPVAIIAKNMGFKVTGCDYSAEGYYYDELVKENIEVIKGHSEEHLKDVDILAVTPAIFDLNPNHPEILEAKRRNILMTWQQFAGEYLHRDKEVIAIAGTHGKSTTTVLLASMLEVAKVDPWVLAGTIYKKWGSGARIGNSNYFVNEADEFNNNFYNYKPSIAIVNNVEMDHPEFFKNFDEVKASFKKFISNLKDKKILIVNEESKGLMEVLNESQDIIKDKDIKVIGYYINNKVEYDFVKEYRGEFIKCENDMTKFRVISKDINEEFEMVLKGYHNISNALGVIIAGFELNINNDIIYEGIKCFDGIGRRSELKADINDIKIYDDYAHHPTEIKAAIESFKLSYKNKRIIVVIEPHQISRLNLMHKEFAEALSISDYCIVTKVFLGRERFKNLKSMDINKFIDEIDGNKSEYIEDYDEVAERIQNIVKRDDIILVLGAGKSYKITKKIIEKLSSKKGKNL